MFPAWFEKDGEKKLFSAPPVETGWEPANGHYDFPTGQWIDDEPDPAKVDPFDHDGDGKAGGSRKKAKG